MSHTPGPWKLEDESDVHASDVLGSDGTHVVCFGHDYDDYGRFGWPKGRWSQKKEEEWNATVEANARLIAAAPELLEALEDVLNCVALCPEHGDVVDAPSKYEDARAAIAKARGTQEG